MTLELAQIVDKKSNKALKEGINNKVRREYARNFRYFHKNYQTLMEKHPNKHVVICDRNVFDYDKDFKVLLERSSKQQNIRSCFIGYVSSPETELIL